MALNKKLGLIALFIAIPVIVSYGQRTISQKINDVQEIAFDQNGQMRSFPKIYLTDKTKPNFTVKVTDKQMKALIGKMAAHLDSIRAILERPGVQSAYNCFFEGENDYDTLKTKLDPLIGLLKNMPGCKPNSWKELMANVSMLNLDSIVPITTYLQNIDSTYKVELYQAGVLVKTIPLSLQGKSCEEGCFQFSAAALLELRDLLGKDCVTNPWSEIHFKLVQDDPWNKTIRGWYKKEENEFPKNNIESITDALITVAATDFRKDPARYAEGIRDLSNLRKWFVRWFWLTKGRLTLDPFNQLTKAERDRATVELKEAELLLLQAKQQAAFLDSARIKTDEKLSKLTDFELVQLKEQKLADEIKVLEKKRDSAKSKLDDDVNLARLKTITILYEGKFKLSERFKNIRGQNPQKQFDAARNYQPIKYRFLQEIKVKEIPEGHKLHILAHNVPGAQGIKIEERAKPFKDEELFTTFVNEQLSSFDFTTIPTGSVEKLQSFAASFKSSSVIDKGISRPDSSVLCGEIQPVIQELRKTLKRQDSIEVFPLNPEVFKNLVRSDPKYKSHLLPTSIEDGEAVIDSVFLKKYVAKDTLKTITVAKTSVKVGEMRYFLLAAGLAIHRSPLTVATVDTAGGGLRTTTSGTRSRAIIGFKFYPFKNYNRDHSILPRFPLRRLSVFFGCEMLKPLENLYLGVSYDIVPGLNISVGENYALETRNRIQNNRITDTSKNYTKTGLYYSASINPVLFVQFVKLFFK